MIHERPALIARLPMAVVGQHANPGRPVNRPGKRGFQALPAIALASALATTPTEALPTPWASSFAAPTPLGSVIAQDLGAPALSLPTQPIADTSTRQADDDGLFGTATVSLNVDPTTGYTTIEDIRYSSLALKSQDGELRAAFDHLRVHLPAGDDLRDDLAPVSRTPL